MFIKYILVDSDYQSYRSWLNRIENESRAVLTITSLELPDCPVPLIDSQIYNRCRTAYSHESQENTVRRDTFSEILSQVKRAKSSGTSGNHQHHDESYEKFWTNNLPIDDNSAIEFYPQNDNRRLRGKLSNLGQSYEDDESNSSRGSIDARGRDARQDDDEKEEPEADGVEQNGDAIERVKEEEEEEEEVVALPNDCMCADISEKLRINIRKKTVRGPSPEVTHTIRIAMKCQQQQQQQQQSYIEASSNKRRTASVATAFLDELAGPNDCCPGVGLALDFTLNCNSVQLNSRDVTVHPLSSTSSTTLDPSDDVPLIVYNQQQQH